jgi:catechol 2,3-dioxygenase-like lactoylglutathione lyase family enzyme
VVLVTTDVERAVAWYGDRLGLPVLRLEEWRRGEVLFPSLRVAEGTIIDVLGGERSGVNVDHIAFVVEDADLAEVVSGGRFEVIGGPTRLFGARGEGEGVYVRDPDGNVVELRTYRD